jgi:uncharacterized protein
MVLRHQGMVNVVVFLVATTTLAIARGDQGSAGKANYERPFEPPTQSALIPLPPGAIEPEGWLRDWCLTARDGYTGHMDDVDIAFRQAWASDYKVSGDRISLWEMGGWPYEGGGYWFDGLAALGFVLHDDALIRQAKKRLNVVVDNMTPNSILFLWWLDRNKPADLKAVEGRGLREPEWPMWVNGLLGRAMVGYYAGSGDKRILKTLETAYGGNADWVRLGWGMTNPWPAFETYRWTGNKVIKEGLTTLFAKGGINQKDWSWNRYRRPPSDKPGAEPTTHGVHFCESTSPWALGYLWTGKREFLDAVLRWHEKIERECMQPHGVPVFDEYYGPTGAFRGTETCDVAAYIWGQNLLLSIAGQGRLADRIERAFFNAGAATVARDFKSHAYFQSPNRMADKSLPAADMYSFLPKRVPLCCTASLNRILPNYVMNMWMATRDNGLAAVCYGPCKVSALVADRVPVEIQCKTDYPFNETIEITVKPAREAKFPLSFRIPGWCKHPGVEVNGEYINASPDANGFVRIERLWKPNDRIQIQLHMLPLIATGKDANAGGAPYACVSLGPLLFALPIADTKDANTPDPAAKWQFAVDARSSKPSFGIAVDRGPMPDKWNWPLESPLKLRLNAVTIDWKPTLENPLPPKRITKGGRTETITLIPYGCTKFRVSMFPVTDKTLNPDDRLIADFLRLQTEVSARKKAELARRQAEAEKQGIQKANPPKDSEGWGPEHDGLRTRLLPVQKEYFIGRPATFRLEMQNVGNHNQTYDSQQVRVSSLVITDPDGKPVSYVGGIYQTSGGAHSIAPGEKNVLFERFDATNQYLFLKPGAYTIQFRGWLRIPPSNKLVIKMQPGTLPMPMRVPARLIAVLPKGWEVSINWRVAEVQNGKVAPPGWEWGPGTYVKLLSDIGGLDDPARVSIWVTESALTLRTNATTEAGAKPEPVATYLGKGVDGHVYWTLRKEAEARWPDIRAKVIGALKIETPESKAGARK